MSGSQFVMVSEWMPSGDINQFVKEHRDTNRFELVSFRPEFVPSSFVVDDQVIP